MSIRTTIRGRIALTAAAAAAAAAVAMPTAAFADGTVGTGGGITLNPCALYGQRLANPGFESGNVSWTASAGTITQDPGEAPHSGTWMAWLGGYGFTHTDSVSQAVTIASGCTATLGFYLHIDTAETTTSTAFDKLTVSVNGVTKAAYSNLNRNDGYVHVIIPLSGVTTSAAISFVGTEDSSLQTSFVIDDTSVTLS